MCVREPGSCPVLSELVWDSESYKAGAPSNNSSEKEGVFKTSQGCHKWNRTDQHPEVKSSAPAHLAFFCCILQKFSHCWQQTLPQPPWQNWWRIFAPPWRDWGRNACVSCENITNGTSHRDKLADYWETTNQFHTRFYGSAMKQDRYLHIFSFLHFTDNNEPDVKDENTDRLWKMRIFFEILNKTFLKFYSSSEYLAVTK